MYAELDNREKGIYRELIDECWVSGAISTDLDVLSRFVREPLDYFIQVWAKIGPKFRALNNGKLTSKRLQEDRRRLVSSRLRACNKAKKAARARWDKPMPVNAPDATSNAQAMLGDAQIQIQKKNKEREDAQASTQPLLVFGEFGRVKLTHEQHLKLKAELSSFFDPYVRRFDCWVNEAPKAKANGVKREDRHAYESILGWYHRDLQEGKIRKPKSTELKVSL